MYGKTLNLRSVDPDTHQCVELLLPTVVRLVDRGVVESCRYGPAFCTMKNGSSCTSHDDFIAVAADGTWDAGDPFDL